jgi:hypothetical protein
VIPEFHVGLGGLVAAQSIALTMVLLSGVAGAQEWVVVRKPSDPGQAGTPVILVDSTSIEILDHGIRRARMKVDWLNGRSDLESIGPEAVSYMIFVRFYDCDQQLVREESLESHLNGGSFHAPVFSNDPKWYTWPENRAADPAVYFLCGWKSK